VVNETGYCCSLKQLLLFTAFPDSALNFFLNIFLFVKVVLLIFDLLNPY
jgi:hypothetical protein